MDNNTDNTNTRSIEDKLDKLSPSEVKDLLISIAEKDASKTDHAFLNAGRSNPNWIATTPRDAFFLLGSFAMEECRRVYDDHTGIAGTPKIDGIADRFRAFLNANSDKPGCELLAHTYSYLIDYRNADPDALALEWTQGIAGAQYPTPDRILKYTEEIVRDYLALTMGNNTQDRGDYKLFATEGSTAGMCYVLDSLQENCLLRSGDGIALMTPIFAPYVEIPSLSRFDFNVTRISANRVDKDGYHAWEYPDKELDKLRDPRIKLVCLVNPSNPESYMLSQHTVERLVDIVKNDNPGLMIITDDVYATFVDGFKSLMYILPFNTMCLYSFSKYFGATGWRTAVIAINDKNIFDYMIQRLPRHESAELRRRYSSLTSDPDTLCFIDRMVADSRMVALNNTAGLGTPQQIQMSLFAAFALYNAHCQGNTFQKQIQKIITDRLDTLWQSAGLTLAPDPLRAGYYSDIDIMVWAKKLYGEDFTEYLRKTYNPLDFTMRLARETSVVVLNGKGFDAPDWSIRISLANLTKEDYALIGTAIKDILNQYHTEMQQSK